MCKDTTIVMVAGLCSPAIVGYDGVRVGVAIAGKIPRNQEL